MRGCEDCLYLQKIETPLGIMGLCRYILDEDIAKIYARPIDCPHGNKNKEDKENKQ